MEILLLRIFLIKDLSGLFSDPTFVQNKKMY